MNSWLIVILAGLGTFLLRYLPLRKVAQRPASSKPRSARSQAFLQAIGPAAITSLLVVSLWPLWTEPPASRALAIVLALASIVITRRFTRDIAIPTLVGATVYGVLVAWLT